MRGLEREQQPGAVTLDLVTAWDFLAVCYHPQDTCSLDYLATAHLDDNPVIMTSGMSGRSASGATSMTGREHLRRRRLAFLMTRALGDLFDGQY